MLFLSGFELYSRWVPLGNDHACGEGQVQPSSYRENEVVFS